jgi:hypothetical protein
MRAPSTIGHNNREIVESKNKIKSNETPNIKNILLKQNAIPTMSIEKKSI